MGIPFGKSVKGNSTTGTNYVCNHTTGTNDVRGNRTTGTNHTKPGHSYSVCITNSNGKPYVIKATRN